MRRSRVAAVLALVLAGALFAAPAPATSMLQLNLDEMATRAGRIYRGTVVRIEPGRVTVGGGELPTLIYTLRVEQAFKGEFEAIKGQTYATLTTLGKMPPVRVGNLVHSGSFLEIPRLAMGASYLLFITPPGAVGLASPVGLGQGCFRILDKDGREEAVNEYRNIGLLRGMDSAAAAGEGPIPYRHLAELIRSNMAARPEPIR